MTFNLKLALIIFLGTAASAFIATRLISAQPRTSVDLQTMSVFTAWAKSHSKVYSSPEEQSYRLSIFLKNLAEVEAHNKLESSYKLGLNHFSDISREEFRAKYLTLKKSSGEGETDYSLLEGTPSNDVDWVAKGAVTPVKNQGQCGSCWAFSSTGALEGLDFIKNKPQQVSSFSEQQLVDCSGSYGNQGCNGGLMQDAFKYVIRNGITTEDKYPYIAKDESCKSKAGLFKITGFKNVPHKSSTALSTACDAQTVSVSIDAENIMKYKSGIFDNKSCGTQLDHGVLLVGYDSGVWKVKNSWGPAWGESGYIRFSRSANSDAQGGICGILLDASFPTL